MTDKIKKTTRKHSAFRIAALLMIIAVLLIVIGVLAGQPDSVLAKAVTVCLECIGIGS